MEARESNKKLQSLKGEHVPHNDHLMTTNQGAGIANTDDSLKAGLRGPTLMQDFIFREKITHFDHERIPERVVHARGSGAHGTFQVYKDMSQLTCAHFLSDPALKTPVFVRFSTVAGFRGSPDTVRDVRGFAVKFYTQEGNYDIVGNNMPVFFVQDAIKFPDFIHAVKPEPHNEMPQAASAHDTLWDFVANTPETMHTILWLMSDRALPQSYRMMDGFGVNTFRLVNKQGAWKFVKFHWKPLLGVHSLVWDEAQKIAGKDPDFNRRDLWETIQNGVPAEWELAIQTIDPQDEWKYGFDILDCTKLWPEELIPLQRIGKMTLDRNVTNFFAETEQVAFCPANIVPGIDFSNDPMLQGRLFSYLDTQISRLGGPNFQELPINRPLAPVNNNQRDGMHRVSIDEGQTNYFPNSLNHNQPHTAVGKETHIDHVHAKVEGDVIRQRSESFMDHYSQAAMFWNSMSLYEKKHIVEAFRFELGKCKNKNTHQRVVNMLGNVNLELATQVAQGIGATPPAPVANPPQDTVSPALSMANTIKSPKTRKVAILLGDGFDKAQFDAVTAELTRAGARFDVIACRLGPITAKGNAAVEANQTFDTAASVFYDAVYVPGGQHVDALSRLGNAIHFINEIYKHYKTVGLSGEAASMLAATKIPEAIQTQPGLPAMDGVVVSENGGDVASFTTSFVAALTQARHFQRDAAVLVISA
jgi:catalase